MLLPGVRTLAMEAVTRAGPGRITEWECALQCTAPSLHLLIPTPRPRPSHGLGTDTLSLISTNIAGTSGEGSVKGEED